MCFLYFALAEKPNVNVHATQIILLILHFVFSSEYDGFRTLFILVIMKVFSENCIIISEKKLLEVVQTQNPCVFIPNASQKRSVIGL